jgi:hypothetical protein
VSSAPPDRATIAAAVMDELLSIRVETDGDAVGVARLVAGGDGTLAGATVVREIMGRVGVRTRSLVEEAVPSSPASPCSSSAGRSPRSVVPRRSPFRG